MSRKSIVANFLEISNTMPVTETQSGTPDADARQPVTPPRVGAGIIGATQRSVTEIREQRDRLLSMVEQGGVLELDTGLIDPSPFPDRLPDDTETEFEAFKNTIKEEGQKVPIQIRRNPADPDRYQIIYGHRRWRAAKELKQTVKALIADLDDTELVVVQGLENAARQDLSWIERALFATQMDKVEIKTRDIRAALSIDDSEIARFRLVTRIIPADIIHSIGRAPRIGRPRWTALARALEQPGAVDRVREALAGKTTTTSDTRFNLAMLAAADTDQPKPTAERLDLRDATGTVLGQALFRNGAVQFRVKGRNKHDDKLIEYLRTELPALLQRFSPDDHDT